MKTNHFKHLSLAILCSVVIVTSGSCAKKNVAETTGTIKTRSSLLNVWSGGYGGVPAWDKVKVEEFPQAFDVAIAEATQDIENIANNPEPPTFGNTFIAMEKAGPALTRLISIFGVHTSNLNVGPMEAIEAEVNPKLSAYSDSITQNAKLFARIEFVYNHSEGLGGPEKRLVENTYKSFKRSGALLNAEQKKRL